MRTIPTLSVLLALAIAGCSIKISLGSSGDDSQHPVDVDAGKNGSGGYSEDAGAYYPDAGCEPPADAAWWDVDAGYYGLDAGCAHFGPDGGAGSACIE